MKSREIFFLAMRYQQVKNNRDLPQGEFMKRKREKFGRFRMLREEEGHTTDLKRFTDPVLPKMAVVHLGSQ